MEFEKASRAGETPPSSHEHGEREAEEALCQDCRRKGPSACLRCPHLGVDAASQGVTLFDPHPPFVLLSQIHLGTGTKTSSFVLTRGGGLLEGESISGAPPSALHPFFHTRWAQPSRQRSLGGGPSRLHLQGRQRPSVRKLPTGRPSPG